MKLKPPVLAGLSLSVLLLFGGCASEGGLQGETAAAYYDLGNAYAELARHEDAVKAYNRAIELEPELFSASFNLAQIYIERSEYGKAALLLDELREREPENGLILEALAWLAYLQDDRERALSHYRRIMALQPANFNAYYNSGVLMEAKGQFRQALNLYEKAYALQPEPELLYDMAFQYLQLEDWERGIELLEGYLDEETQDASAFIALGDAYRRLKLYREALNAYQSAVDLGGVNAAQAVAGGSGRGLSLGRALFEQAIIYFLAVEDGQKGLQKLEKALEAGYRDEERLEELRAALPDDLGEKIRELEAAFEPDADADADAAPSSPEEPLRLP